MKKLMERMTPWVEEGLCIAFSGGVDSSLLLKIACDLGKEQNKPVHAVTFHTTLHPMGDLDIAKEVAEECGALHHIIEVDEFSQVEIGLNPVNRCYLCKKYLFETLKLYAQEQHLPHIAEGTNGDDLSTYRPGIQALEELGIYSPLAEEKITKKTVREWANQLGLPVSSRPSSPCLATRLPYGDPLLPAVLRAIEKGEDFLKKEGFATVRLRVHGNIARIELLSEDFLPFLEKKEQITSYIKELGFDYVTLDLEGFRSGSMDLHLKE